MQQALTSNISCYLFKVGHLASQKTLRLHLGDPCQVKGGYTSFLDPFSPS